MNEMILPNEMTYNGNHLFHYTTLDSAIKIILGNTLRFGKFENMNDIAEVKRELYDEAGSEYLEQIVSQYRAISLTIDSGTNDRGFAIDALWGYYADKGNGVCLVFDRRKLIDEYTKQFRIKNDGIPADLSVKYEDDYSNLNFGEGNTYDQLEKYVKENIEELFYKKDHCWQHEKELRLLVKSPEDTFLALGDSLIGAIICVPKENDYKESSQYKLLANLQEMRNFSIYHYTTKLGKRVLEKDDDWVWPLAGVDYEYNI